MIKKAIYAGSFDPVTFGHLDIIDQASRIFDQLIIGVGENHSKNKLFSLEERIFLLQTATQGFANVVVTSFGGLLVEFAARESVNHLVRGIRHCSDFDYEWQLQSLNSQLQPTIHTVFLMPSEKVRPISATFIKDIAFNGGNIDKFVPQQVAIAIKNKYKK